jgi:hypothetical protein
MKTIFLLVFAILVAQSAVAEEIGRYQAIVFPGTVSTDADKVFILDTKEGHLWTWTKYQKIQGATEGGVYFTYQGKIRPGQRMGDLLEKQPWTP